MYTGVRIEWMEGLDQDPSSLGHVPKQRQAISWTGLSSTRCRVRSHVVVGTSGPRFPSLRLLWPASDGLCWGKEKRSKPPTLGLTEPQPGLLAALATLSVRWFSLCSEWLLVLILYVLFCMEQHFICVLAELFLFILYSFSLFWFLKLCSFFVCVWN